MYPDNSPILEDQVENMSRCCSFNAACNPHSRLHRYLMLIFICFLSFGSYFCYDNPAALQDIFITDLHLTVTQFMNLYAFYSWPNVILSFLAGFLIDRVIGVGWGAIIFSITILSGQVLLALGAFFSSIELMYFARFIFGIGGESLSVCQNAYSTSWFKPTELNFVFGVSLSMARIGSTVNMNTMRPIYATIGKWLDLSSNTQMGISLLLASITCVFSLGCAGCLHFFYKRYRRASAKIEILSEDDKSVPIKRSGSYQSTHDNPLPIDPADAIASGSGDRGQSDLVQEEKIGLKDILHFPLAIWLICVICVAYYVAVFPFVSLGLLFFERKYDLNPSSAAAINSLVFIVSAIASPLFGACIDLFGRNLVWVTAGVSMAVGVHLCFAFTVAVPSPYFLMLTLGMSYSILASSLWPLVGLILPQHKRGTAYGLIQSVQNLGLGVISILTGYIVDNKGYLVLELFFIVCVSSALLATVILFIWDGRNGGLLNRGNKSCLPARF